MNLKTARKFVLPMLIVCTVLASAGIVTIDNVSWLGAGLVGVAVTIFAIAMTIWDESEGK